jgi:hypothetical protein
MESDLKMPDACTICLHLLVELAPLRLLLFVGVQGKLQRLHLLVELSNGLLVGLLLLPQALGAQVKVKAAPLASVGVGH